MVDQTPSSVPSTPRTPRLDLASRLVAKTRKEKKERDKGEQAAGELPGHLSCALLSAAQKKKSLAAGPDPEGLNVEVGDQVLVAGQKHGVVRFFGKTDFAPGQLVTAS